MRIPVGHEPNLGKQRQKAAKNAIEISPLTGRGLKSLGMMAKPSPRYRNHGLIDPDGAVVGDIAMFQQLTPESQKKDRISPPQPVKRRQ
jgi:hypothetical protein